MVIPRVHSGIADTDGRRKRIIRVLGSADNPENVGIKAANELLAEWSR
jgi:hypothetical protein